MAIWLRLKRFCWCCTLKTGSLVIATLTGIIPLLIVVDVIYVLITLPESNDKNEHGTTFRTSYFLTLSITATMLVYGILKKKLYFFLPWLITVCIANIVLTISFMVRFGLTISSTRPVDIIVFMFIFGSGWYILICVYSHYCELKEAKELDIGRANYHASAASTDAQQSSPACVENTENIIEITDRGVVIPCN